MSEAIEVLKTAVRAFLRANCSPVLPKTQTSQKKHLEVWMTKRGGRVLGLEFDHEDLVNIWITTLNIPPSTPESITVARKTPKGSRWTDANGDGANSNLSGYDAFRTKPIARLGIRSVADAEAILSHLNREASAR